MIQINDLGLRTRGILLVTFPVLCQLLFVACLLILLFEAQQDAQREAHSKTVIAQVQHIENNVGNGVMSAILYQASNGMMGEEMTERDIAGVQDEIDKLAKLTADDKVQSANVHKIFLASGPMFENRRILNKLIGAERNTYRQSMEKSGYPQEKAFLTAVLAVVEQENDTRRRNPEQKQIWRFFINILLVAAIAASIALAFILSRMYSTSVTKRLARVAENSQKLSKRQTMEMPLEGRDEIAELDAVLHQVDSVIALASEREKALVENSADIICSIDRDGLFLRVNEASLHNLGYRPQEMIGKTAVVFAAADDANLMTQNIGQSVETGSGQLFECRMHRKDNQFVDTLWSTYWSQQDTALFSVIHDITQRKELERLKEEFVAMVSHDLRTPLTSVMDSIEMMKSGAVGELNEETESELDGAERNLSRLISLINDLLDFEKMQSGTLALEKNACSLIDLVADALRAVKPLCLERAIKITEPSKDFQMLGEHDRLVQVLVNLISNAVDFSPNQGTVIISANQSGSFVHVMITDQGPGIATEYQDSIFQAFEQAPKRPDSNREGTGLGLPIARLMVEAHGGTIGVISEPGQGSTFWFDIPSA